MAQVPEAVLLAVCVDEGVLEAVAELVAVMEDVCVLVAVRVAVGVPATDALSVTVGELVSEAVPV